MLHNPIPLLDRTAFSDDEMRCRAIAFYENIRRQHTAPLGGAPLSRGDLNAVAAYVWSVAHARNQ